jgi:hypothetical protein
MNSPWFVRWAFTHYLDICPPGYALERPRLGEGSPRELAAAV